MVISASDPLSSLEISGCTFRGSYTNATGSPRGVGGAVYATGSLKIENTTFEDNHFGFLNSETNSSWTTPSPITSGATAVPSPAPAGSANTTQVKPNFDDKCVMWLRCRTPNPKAANSEPGWLYPVEGYLLYTNNSITTPRFIVFT